VNRTGSRDSRDKGRLVTGTEPADARQRVNKDARHFRPGQVTSSQCESADSAGDHCRELGMPVADLGVLGDDSPSALSDGGQPDIISGILREMRVVSVDLRTLSTKGGGYGQSSE